MPPNCSTSKLLQPPTEENCAHFGLTWIFHVSEPFICKAFREAVVLVLPQGPDNAANGRLGLARRVKIIMLLCQNDSGHSVTGKIQLKSV